MQYYRTILFINTPYRRLINQYQQCLKNDAFRFFTSVLLFCLAIGIKSGWAAESTPTSFLDSANQAYSKNKFEKASQYYEKVLSLGYESPEIYFNLGNSYYKEDKIGLSVLNYERAKKLAPQDDDIIFNLKLANQRTVDKLEAAPKLFLEEWWDNLKSMRSEKTWSLRSIACFVLFLFFLAVFLTTGKTLNKQFGFWLAIIFFLCSLLSFSIAKSRYGEVANHTTAVIISSSAEIKNAPSENGTKLFLLHEGTKVSSDERNGEWVKIEISSDKIGWVKKNQIEFI
ncbi:MAG TPA: tetratricopeptide repeat protein [Bacteroidia bacterium]